jgi:long-subunit acyl-CoA synthetase (AMP-forming)
MKCVSFKTESTAGISCAAMDDPTVGHVGFPIMQVKSLLIFLFFTTLQSCNEVKIVSVPDLGFFVSQNKGELLVRGPNVFKGEV